jgi:IclR family pca regulon transcriptional regulator
VLTSFSREHPALTLSDVARMTGLTRASARRFLLTLQDLGYVRSDGRQFSLTPKVLEVGYAYLSSLDLWERAQTSMEDLAARTRESCSAATLDGTDIVYVARVPTRRIMTIALTVGTRLPAYPTSMGRVLLAGLAPDALDAYFEAVRPEPLTARTVVDEPCLRKLIDEVRDQGWALVDQELEEGVRSVAAPLRNRDGQVIAALNVSAHAARVSLDEVRRDFLPLLLETAELISRAL